MGDVTAGKRMNLAVVFAGIVLIVTLGLLFEGQLEPARAYTAIVFAVCLAAHSVEQDRRYEREVLRGLQAIADAGKDLRLGDRAGALQAVEQGAKDVVAELGQDKAAVS